MAAEARDNRAKQEIPPELREPFCALLLAAADDKLILGHRNADWTGLAPILEEDIAFSALAQDDIAHAAELYRLVAGLTGDDPDRLAYGRGPGQYRCATIVELDDGFDWGVAIARQLLCSHFDRLRLARLARSAYRPLAEAAGKMAREQELSMGHADQWVVRLARGTDESRERIEQALEKLLPHAPGLFEPVPGQDALEQAGLYPPLERPMFDLWREAIAATLDAAGLQRPIPEPDPARVGGRRGCHDEGFAALLDQLSEVWRIEPTARW